MRDLACIQGPVSIQSFMVLQVMKIKFLRLMIFSHANYTDSILFFSLINFYQAAVITFVSCDPVLIEVVGGDRSLV